MPPLEVLQTAYDALINKASSLLPHNKDHSKELQNYASMLESMNERILPSANKSRDPKKIKQHPTVSTGYVMRIMTIQEEVSV